MIKQCLLATAGLLFVPLTLANSTATTTATGNSSEKPVRIGGDTTVFDKSGNAFSLPARNLGILRRDNFFIGNAFFRQPWVSAPASTTARDGLGPLFNTNSCQGCHIKDGRGHPPINNEKTFLSTLVRISIPATTEAHKEAIKKSGVIPEPTYGDQIQPKATHNITGEGQPQLSYKTIKGKFADGTPYSLIQPSLHITELGYGDLHPDTLTSVRVAPAMIGLGLLDAIKESDLLKNADPEDANQDGISGRPNRVWDKQKQQFSIGRYGWKAGQPTVAQQSMGAFQGDIGITSHLFPQQNCTDKQAQCKNAPHGGQPEISDEIMEKVTFYSSTLAVPARRNKKNPEVLAGEKLFAQANCSACHTPQYTTGEHSSIPELSHQTITPYTDLLLHDMGEGLADHRPEFLANGKEWRTPPLWGIGLVKKVNNHTRFLHDGRARNLMESILWHGGEASASKEKVLNMSKQERDALISFLNSL